MTTEGMPEHVKAWLIERLEGMKIGRPGHMTISDMETFDSSRAGIHNAAIDAVIAMVREG